MGIHHTGEGTHQTGGKTHHTLGGAHLTGGGTRRAGKIILSLAKAFRLKLNYNYNNISPAKYFVSPAHNNSTVPHGYSSHTQDPLDKFPLFLQRTTNALALVVFPLHLS